MIFLLFFGFVISVDEEMANSSLFAVILVLFFVVIFTVLIIAVTEEQYMIQKDYLKICKKHLDEHRQIIFMNVVILLLLKTNSLLIRLGITLQ